MTSLTSGLAGSEELLSGCRAREEKLGGRGRPFLEKTQPPVHQLLPPLGSGKVLLSRRPSRKSSLKPVRVSE